LKFRIIYTRLITRSQGEPTPQNY